MIVRSSYNPPIDSQVSRLGASPKARRRGQALLMAVLLMVFAALLGSTFITVVALNLNQTTRQQDRTSAVTATQAALLLANKHLTESDAGEKWRPEMISPPPYKNDRLQTGATGTPDPNYNVYYTPFEQAQGWARTVPRAYQGESYTDNTVTPNIAVANGDWDNDGNWDPVKDDWAKLETYKQAYGARVFVKFPDPRASTDNTSTPIYLLEVKFLDPTTTKGATGEGSDKRNKLRITAIGLARDNPNVFVRKVSYKGTSVSGSPLAMNYYVANWDTKKDKLLTTELASDTVASGTTIQVKDASGILPGSYIAIGQNVFTTVGSITGNVVTLRNTLPPTVIRAKTSVRAASNLAGNLLNTNDFDADGDGTSEPTFLAPDASHFDASQAGMHINGGAAVSKKATVRINSANNALMNIAGPFTATSGTDAAVINGTTTQPMTTAGAVNADPTESRVRTLAPPRIDSRDYSRYRSLTEFGDVQNGSAYGYGPGLYIDNSEDIEKVATATGFRALSVREMQRLWQRKPFTALVSPAVTDNANVPPGGSAGGVTSATTDLPRHRLAWKRLTTYTGGATDTYTYPMTSGPRSLEQRAVRGWVSPWEFRPRGVFIDLQGTKIVVTRDDRSDTQPNFPDPRKAWKNTAGALIPNTYRMELDLATGTRTFGVPSSPKLVVLGPTSGPKFNGVIFAEGNVRVRGYLATAAASSITIISQGNIYVEGNLRIPRDTITDNPTGARRIALLAKKNVTLNPTLFITHVAGSQDRDVATLNVTLTAPVSASNIISVSDVRSFRIGDRINIRGVTEWPTVVNISPGVTSANIVGVLPGSLTLSSPITAAGAAPVRILCDPAIITGNTPPFDDPKRATIEYFYNTFHANEPIVRDVRLDTDPANPNTTISDDYYLALEHAGERRQAFRLKASGGSGSNEQILSKQDKNTNNIRVESADKFFQTKSTSNAYTFDYDLLQLPDSSSGIRGDDTTQTLDVLHKWFDSSTPPYTGANSAKGKWDMTLGSDSTEPDAIYRPFVPGQVPARRLAEVTTPTGTTEYRVPLLTSVGVFWHPNNANLSDFTQPRFMIGSSYNWNNLNPISPVPPYADADPRVMEPIDTTSVPRFNTVSESFYWERAAGGGPLDRQQARLRWNMRQLTDGTSSPAVTGSNLVTVRPDADDHLPAYRLGGFKIERNNLTTGTYVPALDISVEATIFAQEGSWFVIPMPVLNQNPDVDQTGGYTADDRDAATFFRRLNSRIRVKGNIAQNFTPTTEIDYNDERDPDNFVDGAVKRWIDSLSYPQTVGTNGSASYFQAQGRDWSSITYIGETAPASVNLYLPASPDIIFTS